jgi:D-glycero-D-manno-heptose 1,7-bisphosphate phosphatase
LNRDLRGGTLSSLVAELDAGLSRGQRRWVLDNTYPSRKSRSEVIECAWRHGVPVRCVWVDTSVADAQINAIDRLLAAHGRLPMPEELRDKGKEDPRFFGPDAQFRYARSVEAPTVDEGFSSVERRAVTRKGVVESGARALVLELDGVLVTNAAGDGAALRPEDVQVSDVCRETLARYAADGWLLFATAWRPQASSGATTSAIVERCFERTRQLLGLDIAFAFCPHPAGPPICWCRKPIPGLVLELARSRGVALTRSSLVGRAPADRTMAERLGMEYREVTSFFGTADLPTSAPT